MKLITSMFILFLSMQAFAGKVCVNHRGLYLANITFDVYDAAGVRVDGRAHYNRPVDTKNCFTYNSDHQETMKIRVESVPLLTAPILACEVLAKKGGEVTANVEIVAAATLFFPECSVYGLGDNVEW